MIKIADTPDGLVIRKIEPGGECALRINDDHSVSYCSDHKGPWVLWREALPGWARDALRQLPSPHWGSNRRFSADERLQLRRETMRSMRDAGETLRSIGEVFCVTGGRVWQILKKMEADHG